MSTAKILRKVNTISCFHLILLMLTVDRDSHRWWRSIKNIILWEVLLENADGVCHHAKLRRIHHTVGTATNPTTTTTVHSDDMQSLENKTIYSGLSMSLTNHCLLLQ